MANEPGEGAPVSPIPKIEDPSKRRFFSSVFKLGAGAVAGGIVGRKTAPSTNVGETSSTKTIHLKEFPNLTEFKQLEIGNAPLEGSIEKGPQGFFVNVKNGQRIETLTQELDHGSYVRSDFFDPDGNPIIADLDTRVETSIFKEGDHYLVISRDGNSKSDGNRFAVEVKDVYETDINESFLLYPNRDNPHQVRFQPEALKVFHDGDFGVVLDYNKEVVLKDNPAIYPNGRIINEISVYAQKGGPEQLRDPKASLPESNSQNKLQAGIKVLDSQRIMVLPAVEKGGKTLWPEGSHISILTKVSGGLTWVTRFFTL